MNPEIHEFLLAQYRLYKGFCTSLRRMLAIKKACPHCGKELDD